MYQSLSFFFTLQPKYGGKIIDIATGEVNTREEKAHALKEVKDTILEIGLIVLIGYAQELLLAFYSSLAWKNMVRMIPIDVLFILNLFSFF